MKRNFCINCGTEQQYDGEIIDYYCCERCGSRIHEDGSVSYDGTQDGIERMKDRIRKFDDKENWRRT